MSSFSNGRLLSLPVVLLLVGCVGYLAWRDHQLTRRVADLEQRLDSMREREALRAGRRGDRGRSDGGPSHGARGRTTTRRSPGRDTGGAADPESVALSTPRARQVIEDVVADYAMAERDERRERQEEVFVEYIVEVVEAFAEEQDLDEETAERVATELQESARDVMALREAQMDGEIERAEMREERERIRREADENLTELLGEELFAALDEKLDEGRSRGR